MRICLNLAHNFLETQEVGIRRRRPILSPPGLVIQALPRFEMTMDQSSERNLMAQSIGVRSHHFQIVQVKFVSLSCLKIPGVGIALLVVCLYFYRYPSGARCDYFTSRILGMLWIVTGSLVSSVAQITCNASFLAPCGVMVPLKAVVHLLS